MSEYEKQAQDFLDKHGLKLRATFKGDRCPPWCGEDKRGCVHGDRYRVTIWRPLRDTPSLMDRPARIAFDFWNSANDCQAGNQPTAYDVLASISGDVNCPEDFHEFCGEYGYDADSRKAYATFKRCAEFGRRLRAFFTEAEIEALQEIR